MDDVAFGIEVQFDFTLFNHRIKDGIFLKTTLHTIHLVGDNGDGLLVLLGVFYHLHELPAVADRGGFNHLECLKHRQIFAPAIFL
ncbi:MAG: hypothetical protein SFT92_09485 [Rickettsiales bacterium]|nr:hypothetical protein [Rickettsiales bacterium]